jgi:hypothetical protein
LGLLFLDFSTIFNRFYKVLDSFTKQGRIFCARTLKLLKSLQIYPRFIPLGPDGGVRLAGGEVGLGHANMLGESSIRLTCDRLVAVDRLVRTPASGGGGTAAARPREARRR